MCVLVVEDEPLIREVTSEYLTDRGFSVVTAANGMEAYKLIDSPPARFTILLTDFNMPGPHNGCDVAHRMKLAHPHVHIFIVTGRPDMIRDACGSDLDFPVIEKPFDIKEIADKLSDL